MLCNGCSAALTRVLRGLDGVRFVEITLETQSAVVEHESETPDTAGWIATIEQEGYDAAVV